MDLSKTFNFKTKSCNNIIVPYNLYVTIENENHMEMMENIIEKRASKIIGIRGHEERGMDRERERETLLHSLFI